MINFFRNSALVYALAGPPKLPTIEEWADMHKDKTTPDQIIEAAVVQRMATHFKKWKVNDDDYITEDKRGRGRVQQYADQPYVSSPGYIELNYPGTPGKALRIRLHMYYAKAGLASSTQQGKFIFRWKLAADEIYVNDVRLDAMYANKVWSAWTKLAAEHDELDRVAALAEETMKLNHAKWELIDTTFGMVRNGMGHVVEKKDAKKKRKSVPRQATPKTRRTKPAGFKAGGYTRAQGNRGSRASSLTPLDTLDIPPLSVTDEDWKSE